MTKWPMRLVKKQTIRETFHISFFVSTKKFYQGKCRSIANVMFLMTNLIMLYFAKSFHKKLINPKKLQICFLLLLKFFVLGSFTKFLALFVSIFKSKHSLDSLLEEKNDTMHVQQWNLFSFEKTPKQNKKTKL